MMEENQKKSKTISTSTMMETNEPPSNNQSQTTEQFAPSNGEHLPKLENNQVMDTLVSVQRTYVW